jgi:hypothetical protein
VLHYECHNEDVMQTVSSRKGPNQDITRIYMRSIEVGKDKTKMTRQKGGGDDEEEKKMTVIVTRM